MSNEGWSQGSHLCVFCLVNYGTFLVDIIACDFTDLTEQTHDITSHPEVIGCFLKLICPYMSILYPPRSWWEKHYIFPKMIPKHFAEIQYCHKIQIMLLGLILLYCHMFILLYCIYLPMHWFLLTQWLNTSEDFGLKYLICLTFFLCISYLNSFYIQHLVFIWF